MSESARNDDDARIVLLTHYFPSKGGGVEIAALELAKRLVASSGARITWFASDTTEPPDLPGLECRPIPACNVIERRLGIPWPLWHPSCVRVLWRAIGRARVVHVHDVLYMGNLIAACLAKLRRRPILVTQHIGFVPYRSRVARTLLAIANRILAAPMLSRAECVVFISRSVRTYYDRICRWRREPYFAANGVDTELFRPASNQERERARRALDINDGTPVFIFIGRFVEKKGLPLLRELACATPGASWLFVGDGALDPSTWGLSNVRVFRRVDRLEVRRLLWAADTMVLPSVGEGFPLVVQEATACGLPSFVSTDTLEGYPAARELLLSEALGPSARGRWSSRLQAIMSGRESLPGSAKLVEFACEHWSWRPTVAFYQRQLALLAGGHV